MNKTPLIQELGLKAAKQILNDWPKHAEVWIKVLYRGESDSVGAWYGVKEGYVHCFHHGEATLIDLKFKTVERMLEHWSQFSFQVKEQLVIRKADLQAEFDYYVSIDEARKLLALMPDDAWFYDRGYNKFLNLTGRLAWSEHLNKWIKWFHFDGLNQKLITRELIVQIARTLRVGDKAVLITKGINDSEEVFTVRECDIDQPYINVFRLATDAEIQADARSGSEKFDMYWYGQSEAEAIKEHQSYQEELIHNAVQIRCGKNVKSSLLRYLDTAELEVSHWPQWKREQMK